LGIHYTDSNATVVWVQKQDKHFSIAPVAAVTAGTADNQPGRRESSGPAESLSMIEQLALQVKQQAPAHVPVVLSMSGDLYQSQLHHSQFEQPRQIQQTLRYDIEDEFAIDVESVAFCCQTIPSDSAGTDLMVFTCNRDILQPLLNQFERADLDALVAQPDVQSWLHFLHHQAHLPADQSCVVLAWANDTIYMLFLDRQHQMILQRSFPAPPDQVAELLRVEWKRCLFSLSDSQAPTHLAFHPQGLDQKLIESLAQQCDLQCHPLPALDFATDATDACPVFAAGAAIGYLNLEHSVDFRLDNLPSKTLTRTRHRAVYALVASACAFMLAWIIVLNTYAQKYQSMTRQTDSDIRKAWEIAHADIPFPIETKNLKQSHLEKIKRMIRQRQDNVFRMYRPQSGRTAPDSAGNTFQLILETLNQLPDDFDLKINSLGVNPEKVYTFSGSVRNLQSFEILRNIIQSPPSKLRIIQSSFEPPTSTKVDKTNRRNFSMPLKVIQ